ncbi:unnamed protein product, partial [Pseudo-nitzschia multistriata]
KVAAEEEARKEAEEAAASAKKAKEEAEAKAAPEIEARKIAVEVAVAETKVKTEAEAASKAKAEAEAEAKKIAEEIAVAKAKEEAEAREKAEEEAKAEAKAKMKAEEEATAKAKKESEAKAKKKAEEEAAAIAEAKKIAEEAAAANAKKAADAREKEEAAIIAKIKAEEEATATAKKRAEAEAKEKTREEIAARMKAEAEADAERKAKEELAEAQAKRAFLRTKQPAEVNRMSELERLEQEFGLGDPATEVLEKNGSYFSASENTDQYGLNEPSKDLEENGSYFSASERSDQSLDYQERISTAEVQDDFESLNIIREKHDNIEKEQSEVTARLAELGSIRELEAERQRQKEQTRAKDLLFLQEITGDSNGQMREVEETATSLEENRLDDEAYELADKLTKADEQYKPTDQVLGSTTLLMREVAGLSLKDYNSKERFFSERDAMVHAGNTLSVPVRVSSPGTIVEFSVEKKSYDFGFGITAFMDEGKVEKIKEMTSFRKKTESESIVVPAGCAPCTMQFKFANNYKTLLEKVRLGYEIRVIPPSEETIKLGRRKRAKSALELLESKLSSQREILKTSNARVADLERQAIELEKEIIEKSSKLESIQADEERLKKYLESERSQPSTRRIDSNKYFNDFN